MISTTFLISTFLLLASGGYDVSATPTPSTTTTSTTCSAVSSHNTNAFGIPTGINNPGKRNSGLSSASSSAPNSILLSIRGGELLEPDSVEEVDAIVLNAAANNQLVVIDFTASWCGPCKMIAPLFKELSEEMTNVVFLKVDVDENPDTAAKYSVSAMPTFVFIKAGDVVDRLMGANAARLQELIEEHM